MPYYCKDHPNFEGLDLGRLHDHLEHDHPQLRTIEEIREFSKEKIEEEIFRRSDGQMIQRSWGRPAKVGNYMGDNQKEKS